MAELDGYRELTARLTAMGQTRVLMQRLGLETVGEAKRTVAHKTRTTSRTIRLASFDDDSARVTVGGAGAFLEFGTKAHDIPNGGARSGKVLRFPGKGVSTTLGGRVRTGALRKLGNAAYVFARVVHHPGTKAQPFLVPAARKALGKFGIDEIVSRWNKAA